MRYQVIPGLRVEAVGEQWAAWSPASGETHLLNDESAAVLELLADVGPLSADDAAHHLARETGIDLQQLRAGIELAWLPLEWAGFLRRIGGATP